MPRASFRLRASSSRARLRQLAAEGADISGIAAAPANVHVFAVEALPGQFDQRADSASQCIQFISQGERPDVAFTQVYVIEGECTDDALAAVKHYVINLVETREACLVARETLRIAHPTPKPGSRSSRVSSI